MCEGEWLCKGTWLYRLPEARNWYFIKKDDIELVVRMQHVIDADMQMKPVSSDNELPYNAGDASHMHMMQLEDSALMMRSMIFLWIGPTRWRIGTIMK